MSNDLNRCDFIGRLGNDPEVRQTQNGGYVTNISIAVGEQWRDKTTGDKKESTEWVRCTAFGKLAEIMSQYLKKGSKVYISGKMKTDKYTDKSGVEKYSTTIIANNMQMLDSRDNSQQSAPQAPQSAPADFDDFDDIGF